jgi:sugar phosphate permease
MGIGIPAIAPALRAHYDLSLTELGVVLAAEWIGTLFTLLPWGLLADRIGERRVLGVGLATCGVLLVAAGYAPGFASLALLVGAAGAAGAATNSASGRAVMHWFDADERGLALGIRQSAVPIGGIVAALVLPAIGGVRGPFAFLGAFCLAGALAGFLLVRDRSVDDAVHADDVPWTLRDRRLWRLCFGSGIYLFAQVAVMSYAVLFLHDARGWSNASAALVLAAVQVFALALRIGVGRWSDVLGARLPPLRQVGVASFASLALAAVVLHGPAVVLVPLLILAGGVGMAWNGLAFTAAAELAGPRRSGAAIGFQQTVLSALGVIAPVAFAAVVSAESWRTAYVLAALFPLVGATLLRPLRG